MTILAVQCILVLVSLCFEESFFRPARWDVVLLFFGVLTTWVTSCRNLPGQNVLLASLIIAGIASGFEVMATVMKKPSAPVFHADVFWPVATTWVISILNARGVARILLVRWRAAPAYGLWLIGLTIFLAVLFVFGSGYLGKFDRSGAFGSLARSNLWETGEHGMSFLKLLGTALVSVLLASPSLVNKRPRGDTVTVEPMLIWLSFNIVFVAAAYCDHAFFAAAMIFLSNVLIFSLLSSAAANGPV